MTDEEFREVALAIFKAEQSGSGSAADLTDRALVYYTQHKRKRNPDAEEVGE
jgi:hypothetical protein